MKELFRYRDFTTVSYYNSLLQAEGIPTMLRNEHLHMTGLTEIPITEFYPNICVIHDEDYERAREILQDAMFKDEELSQEERTCPECAEPNPRNFELCYACGKEF